jgi:DNA-directed RNA polymerase I subunit RPA1
LYLMFLKIPCSKGLSPCNLSPSLLHSLPHSPPAGSARDETAYTAADEEDAQVMSEAQRAAARRNLAVNPLEDDSDDDDEDDNEDENRRTSGAADANAREVEEMFAAAAKGKKGSKKAAGDAGVAGPAYTAAQAAAQLNRGLAGLSDASDGINELDHTCSVTISLPLHAPKLLMLEVVEKVAAAVMVQETQGIEKVSVDQALGGPRASSYALFVPRPSAWGGKQPQCGKQHLVNECSACG